MGYITDLEGALELNDVSASTSRHIQPHKNGDSGRSKSTLDDDLLDNAEQDEAEDSSNHTAEEDRAVVRKLDRHLVLFLALLSFLAFLDRSNIGNARIAGLADDLKLSSSEYEWLLTSFYCTYIAFQWMNLLYRVIPTHIYIFLCVLSWSLIASFQAIAGSFPSILILHTLLGVREAAFSPGIPFLLSIFFKREELAFRIGISISAAPLAISFAGGLA
ncbi:hypothetical protein N7G274_009190 [Stereocaulon virgatum]|uniref:Major facilitator superfamily (MFS) profile domain-containing protein n=1 Tax=Stereocaulon virgatum TaxID=373712 RepID=A0ABR3ZZ43_9LECA